MRNIGDAAYQLSTTGINVHSVHLNKEDYDTFISNFRNSQNAELPELENESDVRVAVVIKQIPENSLCQDSYFSCTNGLGGIVYYDLETLQQF